MGSKGWIKRILPFFATFAVGVMIAGFFGFGGPRFGRQGRWRMHAEMDRLRGENEELRNENLRLRNQACQNLDSEFDGVPRVILPVDPPIPLDAPRPTHPDPPRSHR